MPPLKPKNLFKPQWLKNGVQAFMDTENRVNLPVIGSGISKELRQVVQAMVRAHRLIDQCAYNWDTAVHFLGAGLGDVSPGQSMEPMSLAFRVLPFLDHTSFDEELSALVPVNQTMGLAWRWQHSTVELHKRAKLTRYLTAVDRAMPDAADRSETFWVQPLGLFLAHEGKNRVAYLEQEGVNYMPSHVRVLDYPAPERMALHEVDNGGPRTVLCILDNKWVSLLECPEWSVPLLKQYGVKEARWSPEFPALDLVCLALRSRQESTESRWKPVCLEDIQKIVDEEPEDAPLRPIIAHDQFRLCAKAAHIAGGVMLLALMLTSRLWPADWSISIENAVPLLALTTFGGAVAALWLPARLNSEAAAAVRDKAIEMKVQCLNITNRMAAWRRQQQRLSQRPDTE